MSCNSRTPRTRLPLQRYTLGINPYPYTDRMPRGTPVHIIRYTVIQRLYNYNTAYIVVNIRAFSPISNAAHMVHIFWNRGIHHNLLGTSAWFNIIYCTRVQLATALRCAMQYILSHAFTFSFIEKNNFLITPQTILEMFFLNEIDESNNHATYLNSFVLNVSIRLQLR